MKQMWRRWLLMGVWLSACHSDKLAAGPMERAGKSVDRAADATGKALTKAARATGKGAEKAATATGKAFQAVGEKLTGEPARQP